MRPCPLYELEDGEWDQECWSYPSPAQLNAVLGANTACFTKHFHLSHRDKGQTVCVQGTEQQSATTLVWTRSYLMSERYLWVWWRNTGGKKKRVKGVLWLHDRSDSLINGCCQPRQRLWTDVRVLFFLTFSLTNWMRIQESHSSTL